MLYNQKKGTGNKYIFFFHGNSQSHETWDLVVNQSVLNNYTLITVDLPGHGKSFFSTTPEIDYSLKGMAFKIHDFVANFNKHPYIVVANSIATNFIAEIASGLINCKGLFLTGALVIGKDFTLSDILQPNPNLAAAFAANPADDELNSLMNDMAYNITPELKLKGKAIFLSADPKFRTTLSECVAKEAWSDEIKNLENLSIPIAIIYGEFEKISKPDYLNKTAIKKWKDEIILIPNSGHCNQLDQPQILAETIANFAADCFI